MTIVFHKNYSKLESKNLEELLNKVKPYKYKNFYRLHFYKKKRNFDLNESIDKDFTPLVI